MSILRVDWRVLGQVDGRIVIPFASHMTRVCDVLIGRGKELFR